jgi:hypothetical protein
LAMCALTLRGAVGMAIPPIAKDLGNSCRGLGKLVRRI